MVFDVITAESVQVTSGSAQYITQPPILPFNPRAGAMDTGQAKLHFNFTIAGVRCGNACIVSDARKQSLADFALRHRIKSSHGS